ncbi:hypothetical protein ILUMI_22813 [Ignelater luminosus]|uniref:Transcription factor CBF/NF-Y/archaeal histone domain-containing protein n=1 Tax=Ignelater luminosus TaxID=2038154 RepID=A0A8K0CF35_IGNLU|nr:hypothetical protein ILUMI_22813 [Ignelater luminosus]
MSAHLPQTRIKTIIKSSSDVEVVSKESTYLITRAAELFIKKLANQAYKETKRAKKLEYKNIANVVNSDHCYEFLREIIPRKITVREYLKLMKEQGVDIGSDYSVSSSEESSSSEEEKEEEKEEEEIEQETTDTSRNKNDHESSDSDVIVLD